MQPQQPDPSQIARAALQKIASGDQHLGEPGYIAKSTMAAIARDALEAIAAATPAPEDEPASNPLPPLFSVSAPLQTALGRYRLELLQQTTNRDAALQMAIWAADDANRPSYLLDQKSGRADVIYPEESMVLLALREAAHALEGIAAGVSAPHTRRAVNTALARVRFVGRELGEELPRAGELMQPPAAKQHGKAVDISKPTE